MAQTDGSLKFRKTYRDIRHAEEAYFETASHSGDAWAIFTIGFDDAISKK